MRSLGLEITGSLNQDHPNDEMDRSCQVRMRFHIILKTCAFFRDVTTQPARANR